MMLLTLSSYALGEFGHSSGVAVAILLFTAVVKGGFIIRDFMELQGVSLLWRAIMYGWLWAVCLAIAITYSMGMDGGII